MRLLRLIAWIAGYTVQVQNRIFGHKKHLRAIANDSLASKKIFIEDFYFAVIQIEVSLLLQKLQGNHFVSYVSMKRALANSQLLSAPLFQLKY